jgi:formamidopyrimidine-DNA glycosylase
MPELPEVETVMQGLTPFLEGHKINAITIRSPKLRIPIPHEKLQNITHSKIVSLSRRAKYILVHFSSKKTMIIHLGMTGNFSVIPADQKTKIECDRHDHVIFELDNKTKIIYRDPRRFGLIDVINTADLAEYTAFKKLGPEPLDAEFTADILQEKLNGRSMAIKPAIMDQQVVVGVGNIYASEALYLSGIDPTTPSATLDRKRMKALVQNIKSILQAAIASGGSTLRDYRKVGGEAGYFQFHFSVYDKEGQSCPDCTCNIQKTGGIQRIVQAGRSTFYCPKKQK